MTCPPLLFPWEDRLCADRTGVPGKPGLPLQSAPTVTGGDSGGEENGTDRVRKAFREPAVLHNSSWLCPVGIVLELLQRTADAMDLGYESG